MVDRTCTKRWLVAACAGVLTAGLAGGGTIAQAGTISVSSDKSSFLAATGATSATGPLPNVGLVAGGAGASYTVGSVTFFNVPGSDLYFGTAGVPGVVNDDYTLRLPGNDITVSGVESLDAAIASSVWSLGFDFVEPKSDPNLNATFVDSVFTVTLKSGAATVASFTFNADDDTAAFVGVWSDTAFDRVEIRETVGSYENEFYGQFYTGTTPLSVNVVPLPRSASSALAVLGALGVIGAVRRHRRGRR